MTVVHGRSTRAGQYLPQPGGYRAFIPRNLPPDPPVAIDGELLALLSRADQAIGRLDAAVDILPNPELFVAMYVNKEALLSSQIEGVTQASIADIVEYQASRARLGSRPDIAEVVNHVSAMNLGIAELDRLPLSNRLMRRIHKELLTGVRGEDKQPGEFRTTQTWIGDLGCPLQEAAFVPPPPVDMNQALARLEEYFHEDLNIPVLIKTGLLHSQFETIHPFLDGNGRMGRLLITFYLCQRAILKRPLLYLSSYFQEHQKEYYIRLQSVRDDGNFEGWLKFFLVAVGEVAQQAATTVHEILTMREVHRQLIYEHLAGSINGFQLLDFLFESPVTTVTRMAEQLNVSFPTANSLVAEMEALGLLIEVTGQARNRLFRYEPYMVLLSGPGR